MSKKNIDSEKKQEFIITRIFDAPRELVFKAWTEPDHVTHWWGPQGFTAPYCKADIQRGGTFLYCMQSPEGKLYWNKGVYHEIIAPEKIISSMYFADKEGNIVEPTNYGFGPEFPTEMRDVVTFKNHEENKTEFKFHRNISILISKHYLIDQGWNESLDRFEEHLKKIK